VTASVRQAPMISQEANLRARKRPRSTPLPKKYAEYVTVTAPAASPRSTSLESALTMAVPATNTTTRARSVDLDSVHRAPFASVESLTTKRDAAVPAGVGQAIQSEADVRQWARPRQPSRNHRHDEADDPLRQSPPDREGRLRRHSGHAALPFSLLSVPRAPEARDPQHYNGAPARPLQRLSRPEDP
jgi:hypothetical protein